ncbi:MAG: GAF domain-containing sensor histidine kinase [Chloroflexi bacterium]|nr:GAF domain-containing sensor histidine kinase [Chloroflexota bacterium]
MSNDPAVLARRNHELMILNQIAEALNRSTQLDQALQTVLELVAELLGLHTGWVWLLREDQTTHYLAAAYHLPPVLCHPQALEDDCYCLERFRDDDLERAANISVIRCTRLRHVPQGTEVRFHSSIPLMAHGRKLGVFNVASPDWCELSADDLRLLHTVGDLLSMAIERTRLFERSLSLGAVEERNRIAREIHDTLAQGLTAVLLQLETADALFETGATERGRAKIQQALQWTRYNLDEARRSVLDLRAAPLEGRSLVEALATLKHEHDPFSFDVQTIGALQPLPLRIEVGLLRIVQEALNNVRQHAQASAVVIEYHATPTQIEICVHDDGCGFDPTLPKPQHFGLIGMNERTRLLSGSLEIKSTLGAGTEVCIVVPLGSTK